MSDQARVAYVDAKSVDEDDDDRIVAQFAERLICREHYRHARIVRLAALTLCRARGHDPRLRGCKHCRADIAEVAT